MKGWVGGIKKIKHMKLKKEEKKMKKNENKNNKMMAFATDENKLNSRKQSVSLSNISSIFDPRAIETARIAREREFEIKKLQSLFKKLYYGLRTYWWNDIRKSIWQTAWDAGELQQYAIAPGRRQEDGSYSQTEYDWERINSNDPNVGLWSRYRQQFYQEYNAEFLGDLSATSSLRDFQERIERILDVAIDIFGKHLIDRSKNTDEREQMRQALIDINQAQLEKYNTGNSSAQPTCKPQTVVRKTVTALTTAKPQSRQQQREAEAAAFLAAHPEFASETEPTDRPEIISIYRGDELIDELANKAATEAIPF